MCAEPSGISTMSTIGQWECCPFRKQSALSSLETNSGTEVLWTNCDRLSENGTLTEDEFNVLIVYTRNRIALIYHRYLTGLVRKRPLTITLNGLKIEGYDPFYLDHKATQELEKEDIRIDNKRIRIQPYILPTTRRSRFPSTTDLAAKRDF